MATGNRWIAAAFLVWLVWCGGCSPTLPPDDNPAVGVSSVADGWSNSESKDPPPEPHVPEAARAVQPAGQISPATDPWAGPPELAGPTAVVPTAAVSPAAAQVVAKDLLPLVDLQRDSVAGSWVRQGSSIITPAEPRSVLAIPHTPPGDYRWSLVLERVSGYESLNLCLTVARQQTMVVLEGFGGYCRGLNLVDGRAANQNATTTQGRVFQAGAPCTVACTVRRSGPVDYTVQVVCDGQVIIDWTGNPSRLAVDRRFWAQIPRDRLAIAIYERLDQLRGSRHADEALLENLASLLRTVKSAKRSAASPPNYYQAYSKAVLDLSDDLKGLIERLEDPLAVTRPPSTSEVGPPPALCLWVSFVTRQIQNSV